MDKYKITVFTPTYNRANTIDRLYKSLLLQTFYNFEWIIIDDGSTDNTRLIVEKIIQDNKIKVKYKRVNNGGKHRAINLGVRISEGEYFFIVDSDDYLIENSLESINYWLNTLDKEEDFIGVAGKKGFDLDHEVGTSFKKEYIDCTNLEREKYNISGDKAEVFKTQLLKRYPFPEFEGENFIAESLVWNRIANDGYKLRWFNEIIYICEYRDDGLTKMGNEKFINNFEGYVLRTKELIKYNISLKSKIMKVFKCFYIGKLKGIDYRVLGSKLGIKNIFAKIIYVVVCLYSMKEGKK